MRVTFVFRAWGGRFLRAARGLPEFVQVHVARQDEQIAGELFRGCVCKRLSFVFRYSDRQTRHRGADLTGKIELRHGLIDLLRGMGHA